MERRFFLRLQRCDPPVFEIKRIQPLCDAAVTRSVQQLLDLHQVSPQPQESSHPICSEEKEDFTGFRGIPMYVVASASPRRWQRGVAA